MRVRASYLLALLLLLLGGAGETRAQRGPAGPPGVIVARATIVSFPVAIEALGTARANEAVDIRPQVSEAIRAIRFEEGQRVEAGQVLVELHDEEARAEVAAARANLIDFENQERRNRDLFEKRSISRAGLDQSVAHRDAARAVLEAAQARLADSSVRAPFAGRVGLRNVSLGSLVTPQTVITTLDDTDVIKLDFDVPETLLARLETGLSVEARSAAWPDQVFRGRVASIDTRVDPVSRTVTVRAVLPNPAERLRPGMFLTVVLLREDATALVIPEQAIIPEQSRQFVFVLDAEQRVEKREVRTGRRRPGQVEILEGVAEGERVVAEGTQKARPGAAVEIVGELDMTGLVSGRGGP